MNFNINVGDIYVMENKKIVTITEYVKEHQLQMPWKSNVPFDGYRVPGENNYIHFDNEGRPNFGQAEDLEFILHKKITKEANPEYFL